MLQLTLLITSSFLLLCVAKEFHVTPTLPALQHCPPPCHTLDQYAQNTSLFAEHNEISLLFLEGVHNLSYNFELNVYLNPDITMLEFQGQGVPGDTVIYLLHTATIRLSDIVTLKMANIGIITNVLNDLQIFFLQILNMSIVDSTFKNGGPYIFSTKYVLIQNSTFLGGKAGVVAEKPTVLHILNCIFQTTELSIKVSMFTSNCDVLIQDSVLSNGLQGVSVKAEKFTCSVLIQRTNISNMDSIGLNFFSVKNVTIQDSTLSGRQYGVMIIAAEVFDYSVLIQRTKISDMNEIGLSFYYKNNVTITESLIENNRIGAVFYSSSLTVHNTIFTGNDNGLMVMPGPNPFYYLMCTNCTFTLNKNIGLDVTNVPLGIVLTDCSFINNQDTPIFLYGSMIELRGETVFRDNTAERGGGLAMFNSIVIFGPGSKHNVYQ